MRNWIIGTVLAIGTLATGIYIKFFNDTEKAKKEYEKTKEFCLSKIKEMQEQIEAAKIDALKSCNPFESLLPLYISSVEIKDKAIDLKNNLKYIIQITNNRIEEVTNKKDELYQKTNMRIPLSEKLELHKEITELEKLKSVMQNDLEEIKSDFQGYMDRVLIFSQDIQALKIFIRDNCAEKGQLWYNEV